MTLTKEGLHVHALYVTGNVHVEILVLGTNIVEGERNNSKYTPPRTSAHSREEYNELVDNTIPDLNNMLHKMKRICIRGF